MIIRFLKKEYVLVFWIFIVGWLSLKPINTAGISINGIDKLVHFIFYGMMAFLAMVQNVILRKSANKKLMVFLFCALYGFGIEIVQGVFIEGRYFELWDLIANIIGIFIGLIVSNFFFK